MRQITYLYRLRRLEVFSLGMIKISSAGAAKALAGEVRPIALLSFFSLAEAVPAERLGAGSTE